MNPRANGHEIWIRTRQPGDPKPWADEGIVSWVLSRGAFLAFFLTIIVGMWGLVPNAEPWIVWWKMALICLACTAASVATDKLRGEDELE